MSKSIAISNNSIDKYAARLADPKIGIAIKLKFAIDLKDSSDLFLTHEISKNLSIILPVINTMLNEIPPSFSPKALEQKLRSTLLEIVYRVSFGVALKPQVSTLARTLLKIVQTDNEENALASLKILADLHRLYILELHDQVQDFFKTIQDIYIAMSSFSQGFFDEPSTPPAPVAVNSPRVNSPNLELPDPNNRTLSKGINSFKVVLEIPAIMKGFQTSHKDKFQQYVEATSPSLLQYLKVQAKPQMEAHQLAKANNTFYVGVSPLVKNKAKYSEFIASQIKALVFITMLFKSDIISLPSIEEVIEINIRLLCDCPIDQITTRKDLFFSLTYSNRNDARPYIISNLKALLSNEIMGWNCVTTKETQKYLSYSVVAEIIHFYKKEFDLNQFADIIKVFITGLNDHHLAHSTQVVCAKLLLHLVEIISTNNNKFEARKLLVQIFDAFVSKVETMKVTLPNIKKHYLACQADKEYKGFPTLTDLKKNTLENFDFDKIRPLSTLVKPPNDVAEHLKDIRASFKYMYSGLESISRGLYLTNTTTTHNPILQAYYKDIAIGFQPEEVQLFQKLFVDTIACIDLFYFDSPPEEEYIPMRNRDGELLFRVSETSTVNDLIKILVFVFHHSDPYIFQEVMTTHLEYMFDSFVQNQHLAILPKLLLFSEKLGPLFSNLLFTFLMKKLNGLGSSTPIVTSRILYLFCLIFQSFSRYPSTQEHIASSRISTIIRKCLVNSPQSDEADNYYILLNVFFSRSTIIGFPKVLEYAMLVLPQIVTDLSLALYTIQSEEKKNLVVDLLLNISGIISNYVPYLHHFIRPICFALEMDNELLVKGLKVLEHFADTISTDKLADVISPLADQLMYKLWKLFKPPPHDQSPTMTVMRILGKLGKVNRIFLEHAPIIEFQKDYGYDFGILFEFNGTSVTNKINLSNGLKLAHQCLLDNNSDILYKQQSLVFIKSCLAVHITLEEIYPGDIIELRSRIIHCFSSTSDDNFDVNQMQLVPAGEAILKPNEVCERLNRIVSVNHPMPNLKRNVNDENLKTIIDSLFVAASYPEFFDEAWFTIDGVLAYFALSKAVEILDSKPEFGILLPDRNDFSISTNAILNSIVDTMTSNNPKLSELGIKCLTSLELHFIGIVGDKSLLSKVPAYSQILHKLCSYCYKESWFLKEGACNSIMVVVRSFEGIDIRWIKKHELRVVKSLIHSLKCCPTTLNSYSQLIKDSLIYLSKLFYTFDEQVETSTRLESVKDFLQLIVNELFNSNAVFRNIMQDVVNHFATLVKLSISELLQPYAERLIWLMFIRPMRSLPLSLMMGTYDATVFLLKADCAFIKGEEHLPSFVAECLALLDSDDSSFENFESQDESLMANFRIRLIEVILACLSFIEKTSQATTLRTRALKVFFRFLHNPYTELAEASKLGLINLTDQVSRFPKEVLHDVLKPYLTTLSDPSALNLQTVRGLKRLLQILPSYFKTEVGVKLYEGIKQWKLRNLNRDISSSFAGDRNEMNVMVNTIEVFHLLPPSADLFLDQLVPFTIEVETQIRRIVSTPLRENLLLFLNKHASETVDYFFNNMSTYNFPTFFISTLAMKDAQPLQQQVVEKLDKLLEVTIDQPASDHSNDLIYYFINIIYICTRDDASWLLKHPNLFERIVAIWKEVLKEGEPQVNHNVLSKGKLVFLIVNIFMSYFDLNPENVIILYYITNGLVPLKSMDYSFLRRYIRNLVLNADTAKRQVIIKYFINNIGDPAFDTFGLATFAHLIVNPVLLVSFVREEANGLVTTDMTRLLSKKVWCQLNPISSTYNENEEYLKLEMIQLTTFLIQYTPDQLNEYRKDIIQFGFSNLKLHDMICRHAAHLLVARFIAAYVTPENIVMHVYGSLLKVGQTETKFLVRYALDTIIKVLPIRSQKMNADNKFPIWVRCTKQILSDEVYNSTVFCSVYHLIFTHAEIFYPYRRHFLPQMIQMLPRLIYQYIHTESKNAVLQIAETIYKWELLWLEEKNKADVTEETEYNNNEKEETDEASDTTTTPKTPGGKRAVLSPKSEVDTKKMKMSPSDHNINHSNNDIDVQLTDTMKDVILKSLLKLYFFSSDPQLRISYSFKLLPLYAKFINLESWQHLPIHFDILEDSLKIKNVHEVHTNVVMVVEILHVVMQTKLPDWTILNIGSLKEVIALVLKNLSYATACAIHPIIKLLFKHLGDPSQNEYSLEAQNFVSMIETALQKGLNDAYGISAILLILDAVAEYRPDMIDSNIQTLAKHLQKMTREHTNPSNNDKNENPEPSQLTKFRNSFQALTTNDSNMVLTSESTLNNLIVTFNVLKLRISQLGDQRKLFLASLCQLVEKSANLNLLRLLFETTKGWLLNPTESFPTYKEKAALLVSMTEIEKRCDDVLLHEFLSLVLEIYTTPKFLQTELTQKLESAFMLGTRCNFPELKSKFLSILDSSITRKLYSRIQYIFSVHNWERLAECYWIPQALYLLLGTINGETYLRNSPESKKLFMPTTAFIPNPRRVAVPPTDDEKAVALTNKLNALRTNFELCKTGDIIGPLQTLIAKDNSLTHSLWSQIFPLAWGTMTDKESTLTMKSVVTLFTKPYHTKQKDLRPNVIQTLMTGFEKCKPTVIIPPQLIKYLGMQFNAWYVAIQLLDNFLVFIDTNPDKDYTFLIGSIEDALSELFRNLGEDDTFYALWIRRSKYPMTSIAMTHCQFGYWYQAQTILESIQQQVGKTSSLTSCESEYSLWEDQWIVCTERLQQWDTIEDLGEATGNSSLLLRAKWQNINWIEDCVKFQDLVTQHEHNAFGFPFNFQTKLYKSFATISAPNIDLQEQGPEFRLHYRDASQAVANQWYSLPEFASATYIPLLSCCQQLFEASLCGSIFSQLVEVNLNNIEVANENIHKFLEPWRNRLPSPTDSLELWADMVGWRRHVFSSITMILQPLHLKLEKHQAQLNGPVQTYSLLQKGHHELAHLWNQFAKATRHQSQFTTSRLLLFNLQSLPNIHITDAYIKLQEEVKAHLITGDLNKGLDSLNRMTNNILNPTFRSKYFNLKGQFLSQLNRDDEANQAFSDATRMDMTLAKNWAEWGKYNEKVFLKTQNYQNGTFAVNCYVQAANLYRNFKSRHYIAKILYLFNLDDKDNTLTKSFDALKSELPYWYWLTFVPQLLNMLTQPYSATVMAILLQIAKWYPQSLYFHLATAREEVAMLRKVVVTEPDSTRRDVYKQAWDCIAELTDSIKVQAPLFAVSSNLLTLGLSHPPKHKVEETMFYMTGQLVSEAIHTLNSTLTGDTFQPKFDYPKLQQGKLRECAALLPPGPVSDSFHRCFLDRQLSLFEFIDKMSLWRDKFDKVLNLQPTTIPLELFSPDLVNADGPSLKNLLVPGQYLDLNDEIYDLVKVAYFMPDVQVIRSNGNLSYKLSIRAHNGALYSFLVQHGSNPNDRREERMNQLTRHINLMLGKHYQAASRQLHYYQPKIVPLTHAIRLVQFDAPFISLQDIYEDFCAEKGMVKDLPYTHYLRRIHEATHDKLPVDNTQLTNLRLAVVQEISDKFVPPTLLLDFLKRTVPDYTQWWNFHKHLTSQLALTSLFTYAFNVGSRVPSTTLLGLNSGQVWASEAYPTLQSHQPEFQLAEEVPFRLTPNLQHLIGPQNLTGTFLATMVATAQATVGSEIELAYYLPLYFKDEYLFWYLFLKPSAQPPTSPPTNTPAQAPVLLNGLPRQLDPSLDPTADSHPHVSKMKDQVLERLTCLLAIPAKDRESWSKSELTKNPTHLINQATNNLKISMMDLSWMPWL